MMIHPKFTLLTSYFALIVLISIQCTYALPQKKADATKAGSVPVSSALKSVVISSDDVPPTDAVGFLQSGSYFGGQRSALEADDLIQKTMGWGMSFSTVQYDSHQVKGTDFIPGPPENFNKVWKDGAYALALTCYKYGQPIVDQLNSGCKDCGKTFTLAIVWGTYKGMNFDKDLILSAGCSALEITNSDDCFASFPNGCSIRATGEPVDLWNKETKRIISNAKSRDQIIKAIQKYAKDTNQSITLPSSS